MEIEEFKDMFNQNIDKSNPLNNDIMTMIYSDGNGSLATLEKKFKFSLYAFIFVVILFGGRFLADAPSRHHPTAWLLFAILSLEFLFSLFNYAVVKKLKQQQGPVKQNLADKLNVLQNRYYLYLIIHHAMLLLMAIVLEMSMHYHLDPNFEGWAKVNIWVRIAVYAAFFVLQFLVKNHSQKKQYGQYLDKLHTLAAQMQ